LQTPRDPAKLRVDALAMRAEMALHKPAKGPLDVKLARGGLVDLEFMVHHLQLRTRSAFDPHLGRAVAALAASGFLTQDMRAAHDLLTRLLVAVRLVAPDSLFPPAASRGIVAGACRQADWDTLQSAIQATRRAIAANWSQVFEEKLEILE
jgi:[glutamine synthetase] adenylyltransferase / [glutamine synthetase]-adenylyl-L-tyrosine phosphorylase